jgi:phage terminase large subunit GpA-like protein
MHFPLTYSREYFSGLTSEEKIVTWKSGTPRVEWKKRKGIDKARNEPLDVRVYALAALRSLPMASRKLRSGRTYELKRPAKHVAPDVAPDVAPAEQAPAAPAKPAAAVKRAVPARRQQRRGGWWGG